MFQQGEEKQDGGILSWDGPSDPRNPVNWPSSKKWIIMLTACFVYVLSVATPFLFHTANL